jgi:hypothetical protein
MSGYSCGWGQPPMNCNEPPRHRFGREVLMFPKEDYRPQLGSWAPGKYYCKCVECMDIFIGDKRAVRCADCAYGSNGTILAIDD